MPLFKRRTGQATIGSQTWEQTLVAREAEAAPEGPTAPESAQVLEPPPEPTRAETTREVLAPEGAESPGEGLLATVAPDLQPFVRLEEDRLVLEEAYLDPDVKAALEAEVSRGRRVRYSEQEWIPSAAAEVQEAEAGVDALRWESRLDGQVGDWGRARAEKRLKALEAAQTPPRPVVGQRLLYRMRHGFVVELAYDDRGRTRHAHFWMTGRPRPAALARREYRGATLLTPEFFDAFVASRAPRRRA